MVSSRARLRITLTARRSAHYMQVLESRVALTTTVDSSIAHIRRKGNKIKEKAGMGEGSQTE